MFYVFEANFDPNPSFYTKYFLVDFRETLVLLLFSPRERTKAQPEDLTSSASLGREKRMQPLRDTDPKSRLDGGATRKMPRRESPFSVCPTKQKAKNISICYTDSERETTNYEHKEQTGISEECSLNAGNLRSI